MTTGRPRRCGWFDAVVNRYAAQVNGLTDIVLTKLDVLTGLKEIPLCVAYDVNGERRDDMPTDQAEFAAAKPIYESMPGWDEDISQVHDFSDSPRKPARNAQRRALVELLISALRMARQGDDDIIEINSPIDQPIGLIVEGTVGRRGQGRWLVRWPVHFAYGVRWRARMTHTAYTPTGCAAEERKRGVR